ncbi:MAG TPA: pitrilysin family protein [Blastocatellia bacterium]|nr:pitrilysin family protein [Blastocatellia bacterium]
MKTRLLSTVRVATVLFLSVVATAVAFAKPQWQTITLKNGLQVIVIENRSVPLVTIEIAVKNGSYTEPPEFNGLSHLYEHMFFKTNERSKTEGYMDAAAELGVLRNAQTREEVVNYYSTTVKTSLRGGMLLMRDAIRYPLFDKQELEQEREVVLDEFSRNQSNPFYFLNRAIDERLWYKYFSRKNPLGERDVISTATPEKMRTIQQKFYVPNNSALIVAGDVSAPEIFRMAEELYGDWARTEDPFIKNPLVKHPPLEKDEAVIVTQPVQAATIFMAWHGPSTDTDAAGTYAADVFSFILRQPDSKFQRALVDSGITTLAGLGYLTQRNVGPIQLTSQTTPDKLKQAIKAVNAEVAKFDAPDYFTDEQLESAKTLIDVNEIFGREKPSEYAHTVSFWWASSGLDYYATYVENVRKVTRADIQKYVRQYIKGKNRVVGVLLSDADKKRIALTEQDLLVK